MKVCSKCEIEKELIFFNKRKDSKDGYRNDCKECYKNRSEIYYEKNKENLLLQKKKYYENNKEILSIKHKNYYENNKEVCINYSKEYYKNNREKISEREKKYKERKKIYYKKYFNDRLKSDNLFKIKHYMKSMIRSSFNQQGYTKKSRTGEILGISFEEFKLYIENKFECWMTWDNHGLYNGELNYGWDIDHIIPLSSAETEEDVTILNHYTNFQPLCSYTNRYIKKDNY
jgi:hypothetical protein